MAVAWEPDQLSAKGTGGESGSVRFSPGRTDLPRRRGGARRGILVVRDSIRPPTDDRASTAIIFRLDPVSAALVGAAGAGQSVGESAIDTNGQDKFTSDPKIQVL